MTEINYQDLAWPVRDEVTTAQRHAWERLGQPGTWLTGAERTIIAAEARNAAGCKLCQDRKTALSPGSVSGAHDHLGALSELEVEQIHRIFTDPGRLTRAWYQDLLDGGVEEERYVEAVGVIVTVVTLDTFNKGLGMAPWPLPVAQAGEPSRIRPAAAKRQMAWVSTLAPKDVFGTVDEDLYGGATEAAHIVQALSLVPPEKQSFFGLVDQQYMLGTQMYDFENEIRAISHAQIELVAGRVSAINQCVY